MPTPKNGFQVLNLPLKKHVFKKNTLFVMYFCLSITSIFNAYKFISGFAP